MTAFGLDIEPQVKENEFLKSISIQEDASMRVKVPKLPPVQKKSSPDKS
jgi:hypothetical protein